MEPMKITPISSSRKLSKEPGDYERYMVERWNKKPGDLGGIDCPKCLNRGVWYRYDADTDTIVQVTCECMQRRKAQRRLEQSGLSSAMQCMTFDTYQADEPWQVRLKARAMAYAAHPEGWLFMGGQVGCGKTHLCTAALRVLSGRYPVHYMLWRDESAKIKAALNDPEGVELMHKLKTVPVLYIDDLFKGADTSKGDKNLAFELINARYNDPGLLTIISTEKMIGELVEIDEAIGSRIAERSRGNRNEVKRDPARNWRLK